MRKEILNLICVHSFIFDFLRSFLFFDKSHKFIPRVHVYTLFVDHESLFFGKMK